MMYFHHLVKGAFMKNAALKAALLGISLLAIGTGTAHAAFITGSMGITGNYSATGGSSLADATDVTLNSASGTSGTGDLGTTVSFGTAGTTPNGSFSISPFAPTANVILIGGWQLDLASLTVIDQTSSLLTMEGSGVLSGNGFQATGADWSFSAQNASSYSLTVTAVPVPAAVWLFGSGLIGLVTVARRRMT